MYGQVFENKKQSFGGGYPIWMELERVVASGGVIQDMPKKEFLYPAGSAVEITKGGSTGTKAKILGFYEIHEASSTPTIKVKKGFGYIEPQVGRHIMIAGNTIDATGKGVTINAVVVETDHYVLTLSDDLGSVSENGFLQDASAAGVDVAPYALPDGLIQDDIYITQYTEMATAGAVYRGAISAQNMPPHPMSLERHLQGIHFDKNFK